MNETEEKAQRAQREGEWVSNHKNTIVLKFICVLP